MNSKISRRKAAEILILMDLCVISSMTLGAYLCKVSSVFNINLYMLGLELIDIIIIPSLFILVVVTLIFIESSIKSIINIK
jgi:cytochrome c oxidase subunit IV